MNIYCTGLPRDDQLGKIKDELQKQLKNRSIAHVLPCTVLVKKQLTIGIHITIIVQHSQRNYVCNNSYTSIVFVSNTSLYPQSFCYLYMYVQVHTCVYM